jgi:DNA-binding HxlR family transcriptional regulator
MAYQKKLPVTLNCGLDLLGEVLYGKWKIRLLYFIHEGHRRPGELQRKIPDASRRVLNMQLNELEAHELITKKIYAQLPPKVEYSLTGLGISLMPVINALGLWADEHQEQLRNVIQRANTTINGNNGAIINDDISR